jgi:hypothetical protein
VTAAGPGAPARPGRDTWVCAWDRDTDAMARIIRAASNLSGESSR